MPVNIEVRFDNNPQGIYYVGQTAAGSVVLHLDQPETVKEIYFKLEGFTVVNWSERRPHGQRRRSRQFCGRRDYMNTITALAGTQHGPPIEIPAGTHVYNFTCLLPEMLPTSFEGRNGHIRYTITVVIERPSLQSTVYREAFTVLKNVNLNDTPALWNPVKLRETKTFGWWVFKSDPLDITVEIPYTGYVPGQIIPVLIQWENNTNISIHGFRIKLYKIENCSATEPYEKTRTDSQSIAKIENRDLHQQGKVRFERGILIPATAPSMATPLITVTYELRIFIHISGGDNAEFVIPVVIGTIPLIGPPPHTRTTSDGGDDPSGNDGPSPPGYGFKFGAPSPSDDVPPGKGASGTQQMTDQGPSTSSQMPSAPNNNNPTQQMQQDLRK
ncbi:arrestin domain-containing protein 2-like [Uranotaenia lowii]|uniref:arrestin domain-containing protein 2-like n=1 Tax=Uranotaenia lowii TaxID=190385 RepID=UPI00247AC251|nr:arrestin domain-containing protein 2-like [Uranotaenia lowii]